MKRMSTVNVPADLVQNFLREVALMGGGSWPASHALAEALRVGTNPAPAEPTPAQQALEVLIRNGVEAFELDEDMIQADLGAVGVLVANDVLNTGKVTVRTYREAQGPDDNAQMTEVADIAPADISTVLFGETV